MKVIKKIIWKYIIDKFFTVNAKKYLFNIYWNFATESYSQEWEDILINYIFSNKNDWFYIDIWAHHPKRFSNTYLLYKKWWKWINIDPNPWIMKLFNKIRPRDINLEIWISNTEKLLTYYIFNEPALNWFDKNLSNTRHENSDNNYEIIWTKEIETFTLENILDKYSDVNKEIDLLSVDVEWIDLEVLKSNNWNKFKPKYILVEILQTKFDKLDKTNIYLFLCEVWYEFKSKLINTVLFERK